MSAKESDFSFERVSAPFFRASGWSTPPQRFVLDTGLFLEVFQSKGLWRADNVTRIPVIDEHDPSAGATWIDARLFSDGYLRGNVKARSGEIQSIVVDVSEKLTDKY